MQTITTYSKGRIFIMRFQQLSRTMHNLFLFLLPLSSAC
jgi:hypothetical protein